MNLLRETLAALTDARKTPADVDWVGTADGTTASGWRAFAEFAARYDYDNGFGSVEVPEELVIVLLDGSWFERYTYDGAESWEYKRTPRRYPTAGPLTLTRALTDGTES